MAITSATGFNAASATTTVITYPSTAAAGDLIIVICGLDVGASTSTNNGGLTELKDETGTDVWAWIGYKKAAGGETGVTLTHTSEKGTWIALLIPAAEWHGTTVPEITAVGNGTSGAPDPPSITPSWGAAAGTTFIAIVIADDSAEAFPITAWPTGYTTNQVQEFGGTSAASVAAAIKIAATSPEDPATFTMTGTEHWRTYTLAVRGSAGTLFTTSLTAALSFSGGFSKRPNKALTAGLSFSGAFSKRPARSLTAALTFAGAFTKRTARSLTGALSFSGALSAARVFLVNLTAALTFSGSLVKSPRKALTAALTFSGAFSKRTARAFTAALSFSGSIAKRAGKTFTGALSFVGALLTSLVHPPPAASTPGLPSVNYVIELYNSGGTFGPNTKLGEVWDARNLGWSRFDRLPGKAFFTLGQRSPYLSSLVAKTTHVKIIRITPTATKIVWSGTIEEFDSTGDDVIVIGYNYVSLLSLSRSGFKTLYPTKALGSEIVSPEWTLAKNATSSPLGFVTTGTIEDPLGTDGSTVIKTNAQFGTLDQMRLQLFYDLSEMGRANTTNYVTYEITDDPPHTFNFWKNKGATQAGGFVLGGNVSDYHYQPNWITYRNDWASVAMAAAGGPVEIVAKDDSAAAAKGRRQDVFTAKTLLGLSGAATEADQQAAALQRQLKRGLQLQPALMMEIMAGTYTPGVIGLCDRVPMEIVNGADSITGLWSFLGETCLVDAEGEHPTVLVRPLAA